MLGPPSSSPTAAGSATGSTSGSATGTPAASGRHVNTSALVDALREGTELQQGAARHRATGPVDTVQLLSAVVDGSGRTSGGGQVGTSLGALSAPADAGAALLSTEASARRTTPGTTGSADTVLLLTTVGAALALAGTALETARRQRVRAAVARGRGRRARR
ncbi:hypothetical protein ACUN7V_07890 [Quadrisphaera oryzae]|uniref:hypothetical protein n=1 Tax=Quadrisphaera TaxID=317661 RepID=UPI0016440C96|nr:hypothetical protein [Quadrisphaera sp. RL12-1S]MBC3761694.1 hypothetical protein [Quadrisphaera sp. RL12-1S]